MASVALPEVSVLFAFSGDTDFLPITLASLRAQTAFNHMELVFVMSRDTSIDVVALGLAEFCWHQVLDVESSFTRAEAIAAGVRIARAPIVAIIEDHVYPERDWLEAIARAFREGNWAVVGARLQNANPDSALSHADFMLGYSRWLEIPTARTMDFLPGHNTSYRRDVLLDYGDDLEPMLGAETVMHWDLRAKGHQLYHEPSVRLNHVNCSLFRPSYMGVLLSSRIFAALRARQWFPGKRILYAGGTVLLPFVRLARIWQHVPSLRRNPRAALPIMLYMFVLLTGSAFGEMLGYGFGNGNALQALEPYESRRLAMTNARDQAKFSKMAQGS